MVGNCDIAQLYLLGIVQKAPLQLNSHYEKYEDDFQYEGKPSCATTKSTPFVVSQDEWDTKEDTGKSMKNALRYAKRHLSGRNNVEQN